MVKKQSYRDKANEQTKQIILENIKEQRPETTPQLIKLVQEKTSLTHEEINQLLMGLESEDRIHFTQKETPISPTPKAYLFSKQARWYWVTVALAFITVITVFAIPDTAYPIVYLRSALGVIFILFLPGFTFIKMLYPTKVPIATNSQNIDAVERLALSLGLSLSIIPIVGLILNYSPWGIRVAPITLSLLALTVVSATAAVLREYQAKTQAVKISA